MKKRNRLVLWLLMNFGFIFSLFPSSINSDHMVLKYTLSNSFEKGIETVYYLKDKYCLQHYTEEISQSELPIPEQFNSPLLNSKKPKSAYRIVMDGQYIYNINDIDKNIVRTDRLRFPNLSEIKNKSDKQFYESKNKALIDEIENIIKSKYSVPFQAIQNSKKITYFGKPCNTFIHMGATFIYWEDILLYREIPFQDNTKEILQIQSIEMNSEIDPSVFEVPSYYKMKHIDKKDFVSLITKFNQEAKKTVDNQQ